MPTIEERALEKLNEVRKEWSAGLLGNAFTRLSDPTIEAFCREIETHDAERAAHAQFRQEVSDKAEVVQKLHPTAACYLGDLILPKPVDPLVEAIREASVSDADSGDAERLRAALAKHGLKLVEVGDAD